MADSFGEGVADTAWQASDIRIEDVQGNASDSFLDDTQEVGHYRLSMSLYLNDRGFLYFLM